jgi:hypothetical protein
MLQVNQLIGFGAGGAGPAVPTMRGTPTVASGNPGATRTIAHTVDAAYRNCLMVRISVTDVSTGAIVTNVAWNGAALTKAKEGISSGALSCGGSIWYLVNPEVGSFNVVVSYTSNPSGDYVRCENWQGVNPTTPIGGTAAQISNSATALVANVTKTKTLSLVLGVAGYDGSPTSAVPVGSGVVEEIDIKANGLLSWLGYNLTNGNMAATSDVASFCGLAAVELNGDA